MRLVTFTLPGPAAEMAAGWVDGDWVISAPRAQEWIRAAGRRTPAWRVRDAMISLLGAGSVLQELRQALGDDRPDGVAWRLSEVRLRAPLPQPRTVRDFYAFEAHIKNALARRGREMNQDWYKMPVFYFSNPNAAYGPGEEIPKPKFTEWLDFELEVAAVIGRQGRDIPAERAYEYIAGYMIMNDWSARDVQRQEMKVGLGPAKGKDFATSFGPWLVTPDELADRFEGGRHRLAMVARINGREVSRGNLADLHFTFGQMIERASQDCTLYPGEVIGSGTVGTGCLLETEAAPWLQSGDVVELEVERLGTLMNTVR